MRVVIRVDSSAQIGSGHLMRCLTLAEQLQKKKNAEVHFISRDLQGSLHSLISQKNFPLHLLPRHEENQSLTGYAAWLTVAQEMDADETQTILQDIGKVDLLVVDSYALDIAWESRMRLYAEKIFVIDDLANRQHDCDVLLDQNYHKYGGRHRYDGLVPRGCRLLLGPAHVLLREEFYEARKHLRKRNGQIRRILVFYGGADLTNETGKAVKALVNLYARMNGDKRYEGNLSLDFMADIIVGGSNPRREEIRAACNRKGYLRYHCQVENMAEFMAGADLMLGASGSTTWERCYLGLPAIVTSIADNQHQGVQEFADAGFIHYLGRAEHVKEQNIAEAVLLMTPERLASYRTAGESLMGVNEGRRRDEFF